MGTRDIFGIRVLNQVKIGDDTFDISHTNHIYLSALPMCKQKSKRVVSRRCLSNTKDVASTSLIIEERNEPVFLCKSAVGS